MLKSDAGGSWQGSGTWGPSPVGGPGLKILLTWKPGPDQGPKACDLDRSAVLYLDETEDSARDMLWPAPGL